jgi:hypothetical protein
MYERLLGDWIVPDQVGKWREREKKWENRCPLQILSEHQLG